MCSVQGRRRAGSIFTVAEPSLPTGRLRATVQRVTSHAGAGEAGATASASHWAICFLKDCALLLSEQPLIRVIYKEPGPGWHWNVAECRAETDGPARLRGSSRQRGRGPAAPPLDTLGSSAGGSRQRRAADSGRSGLGWVESPVPPRVSVASCPRGRGAGVLAGAAGIGLSRRVRAPQPGTWGAPRARLLVGQAPRRGQVAWWGPWGVAPACVGPLPLPPRRGDSAPDV